MNSKREEIRKDMQGVTDPSDYFANQIKSLRAISWTEWYKQIRLYFARELDKGFKELCKTPFTDQHKLAYLQASCSLANQFLDFLDNLEWMSNLQE